MKPTLLIMTDWFLPGYKAGGPIRSIANLCRELAGDYELLILTGDRDYGDEEPYAEISPNTWIAWEGGAKVWYASPGWLTLSSLERLIKEVNPVYVYLNSMFSVKFAVWPVYLLAMKRMSAQLVWAPRGMLHKGAIQYKKGRKLLFLAWVRLMGLPAHMIFHATDEQEAEDITQYMGAKASPSVIANLTHLPSLPPTRKLKVAGQLVMGFISRIHPKKNLAFLLAVLQKVSAQVTLLIWGPVEDEAYWENCQALIENLPGNIQVLYGGVLTHKGVEEKLSVVDVFALPTHGENFGHAIFEAFAKGAPVIISQKTPWRALEKENAGWDLPLEEELWTQQLEEIAKLDQKEFQFWQKGARAYAEKKSQNAALVTSYKSLFLSDV